MILRSAKLLLQKSPSCFVFQNKEFLGLINAQSIAAYKVVHSMAQQLAQRQRSLNQKRLKIWIEI